MLLPTTKGFDISAFLVALGVESRASQYRKKQVIFSQGDQSDTLFYIRKGRVKLTVVSKKGKEAIVYLSGNGSFFGESCIASGRPVRFHSAVTVTDVQLVRIDRSSIIRLLRRGGDISLAFIGAVLKHNAEIQQNLANRFVESSQENLARVVALLAESNQKESAEPLPRISQQTMAEMIGITRQRVNVLMKQAQKARFAGDLKGKAGGASK
jgi:CRP-like cAMP-binding protein